MRRPDSSAPSAARHTASIHDDAASSLLGR